MKNIVTWLVWILMVVGSVNWGLDAMGMSLFTLPVLSNLQVLIKYLVGLAGVTSLVMYFMGMHSPDCCK